MLNSEKKTPREPADIRDRTMRYAVRAVKLHQHLQSRRDGAGKILGKQYLRAATSIGVNLIEAQADESRRDFIHKCAIAQKEARESKYWLELLVNSGLIGEHRLGDLLDETDQIIAILTAILVKSKNRRAD